MKRNDALNALSSRADAMRERGVFAAYLYGSTIRNEAGFESDLDVFVDILPGRKFSLIDLAGLHRYLEGEMGIPVDITTRGSIHPKLREDIEREAVRVF